MQKYTLSEKEGFSYFYRNEQGEIITRVYQKEKDAYRGWVKFTDLEMVDISPDISKMIISEKIEEEKIKEDFNPSLIKKGYVYYYHELMGKDKEGNLYVKVEAKKPEVKKLAKKLIQVYKYNPERRLLSIFIERERLAGTYNIIVTEDGVVYELFIPILDCQELPELVQEYSPDGEIWDYVGYKTTFPEYVEVIKWEKKR